MKVIPTIKHVAESAGVSTATVSNVLQGKSTLYTSETAARVWEAVQKLEYKPNRIAQSLVRRHSHTLGVVVHGNHGRITRNSYVSGVLDGFLGYSVNAGYQIKILSFVPDDPRAAAAQVEDGSMDGALLVALPEQSALLEWACRTTLPVVAAGSVPLNTALPCVDVDDLTAQYEAVQWLIRQGHRRIGYITGYRTQWSALRREQGYRRALIEAGIEPTDAWVAIGDYGACGGERAIHELLDRNQGLTAVVCANDWTALGALAALKERGVRVPEDLSLIGFDDMQVAEWVQPALTTVRQPMSEIGATAAEWLISKIAGNPLPAETKLLPSELIVRQSVLPLHEVAVVQRRERVTEQII